jgi:hypothetical protein
VVEAHLARPSLAARWWAAIRVASRRAWIWFKEH